MAERAARVLLALYVAGDRGILAADLMAAVGTSKPTLYRMLALLRGAGWRITSERGSVEGVSVATYTLDAWQVLPRAIKRRPAANVSRLL
jgi:predicted DNA-binding transcriptional regulator YafY